MRTIAQISDMHFGAHDPLVTEDLIKSVHAAKPDLVVLSGDFTQRARKNQFREARQFVDRLPEPKLVVPGNHDMPLFDLFSRIFRPFSNYERYIKPAGIVGARYSDPEIAVLGLNTARRFTGKNGRISREQLQTIADFFATVPDGALRIVVTHHPLGQPDDEVFLELALRSVLALHAIVKEGVQMLLSGHHHRALSGSIEETEDHEQALIVYAGTANSKRLREGDGNSYNLIRVDGHDVEVRVMRWVPGKGFVEGRTSSYRYGAGGWERHSPHAPVAAD